MMPFFGSKKIYESPCGIRGLVKSAVCMSEIVEAVSEEQLEQVRNLFCEYQAELPPQYRALSLHAELSSLPGVYGPPKGVLLLATVTGQPVGCVGLRPFSLAGACEMKR